jgi:hypothetical protein
VRVDDILRRQFSEDLARIHLARVRLVFAAACALLRGGKTSLTAIGRAIATATTHKHGIKRVDRLLGNAAVWRERIAFYRGVARRLIPPGTRPVVIVDWTSFSPRLWALVAAVSFDGRAIVVYSETHSVGKYIKPAINKAFLRRLRQVLPTNCTPIILTDAGFRSPWMREVARLGWDYVCRVRGLSRLREIGTRDWKPLLSFFARVGSGAKNFGECEIAIRARHQTRIVGFALRRRRGWKERWGALVRSTANKAIRSAREPWILATSLNISPKKIVALYRRRMQIEETFRDAKSTRFGFSMDHARTRLARRADILFLLVSLAHLLSMIVGLVAEASKLHRGYQANTLRSRRVLSLSLLGRLLMASKDFHRVTAASLESSCDRLFEWVSGLACAF